MKALRPTTLVAVALLGAAGLGDSSAAQPVPAGSTAAATPPRPGQPFARGTPHTVAVDAYSFLVDGQRVNLWAGEFHYFRLPSPDLWRDILVKLKAGGHNAVSFYFDWAYHSPKRGEYDFTGVRDVEKLLTMAEELGLYVIARPGPYINAEVDSGGLPGWLTTEKGRARSNAADYKASGDEWLTQIDRIIARHQLTNGGGTVISYQIENEFYDRSPEGRLYIEHLKAKARADGITVPLVGNHNNNYNAGVGVLDIDMPDQYPQGFNCSTPKEWRPLADLPGGRAPGRMLGVGEFQGGAFDPWGGPGYAACAELTGPDFAKVFYKANIAAGATQQSFYMTYGGTSWGWQPDPQQVYSSYDYGAAISEPRQLTPKFDEHKRQGWFTQAVAPLAKTDALAVKAPSSVAVVDIGRINPDTRTQFHILRQADSTSTANATASIELDLNAGSPAGQAPVAADIYPVVPQQAGTSIRLAGRDSKILVANYALGAQRLQYSTSEIMTHAAIAGRDIALLYGRAGQDGETVLRYAAQPAVTVLAGEVQSTWDAKRGDLRLNYKHDGLARLLVTGESRPLLLLLGTDEAAATFWPEHTASGPVLVRGPYLLREAERAGAALALTGDTAKAGELEVFSDALSLTWNGRPVTTAATPSGSRLGALPGPVAVALPALKNWRYAPGSPEAEPSFDDSGWVLADKRTTNSITAPTTLPVLFGDDYGFHYGDLWYRGRFRGDGAQTGVHLTAMTGRAGVWSAWLDGRFLGSSTEFQKTFAFPPGALRQGGENVLSVLVENMGHNEDYRRDDTHKEARGLTGASLVGAPFASIAWRIQGARGGQDLFDKVRGPMNNGGLHGERAGWSLPGFPDGKWARVTLPHADRRPGVSWYRTTVRLDLPRGQDTSVGLRFDDPEPRAYRAQLFVNGWLMGRYVSNVGPQKSFPIPNGILEQNGVNTIALAVWNEDGATGGLGKISLETYGSQLSPQRTAVVESPAYAARRYRSPGARPVAQAVPPPAIAPAPPPAGVSPLSALPLLAAGSNWGPAEIDRSVGGTEAGDGKPISLAGTTHVSGLGVGAPSGVAVHLGGRCSRFTALVGIDDEVGDRGSATFSVQADGRTLFKSDTRTGASPALPVDVDITGAQVLRLIVDPTPDGTDRDRADWAEAQVTCR